MKYYYLLLFVVFSQAIHGMDIIYEGAPPSLAKAVSDNDSEEVNSYLGKGADLDDLNEAMRVAAVRGNQFLVKLLFAYGAQVDAPDCDEEQPIHLAAYNGHDDVITFLLNNGARVDAPGRYKFRPLHNAVYCSRLSTIKLLLQRGATIDKGNKSNIPPLQYAADTSCCGIAPLRLLIKAGANVNACDDKGEFALVRAAFVGSSQAVRLLLESGATPDSECLGHAALRGDCDMIEAGFQKW